jgi:hypothetical protein
MVRPAVRQLRSDMGVNFERRLTADWACLSVFGLFSACPDVKIVAESDSPEEQRWLLRHSKENPR